MPHFWKSCGICMIWLVISELLCLILAFSFAIINTSWIRWLSLLCGITAHCLLMGSCAQKIAQEDAALYRISRKRVSQKKPLLLAVFTVIPGVLLYLILMLNADSKLMLNLFPLLNSPYIQLHRLLIGGKEPFSAIAPLRRAVMALPPVITGAAFWVGYQVTYIPALAKMDAKTPRS
ncbi:MAG: hypothetical protein IJ060_01725 [Oscillospiraceae bacterium]|nr:hypothetical protein [Oscillospiraceae bacterium]